MTCQAMHFWTLSGLVGAFLDLAIAYFLLCASTIAFFASKFMGFFGLSLPCPCDGLFVNPNSNYCLHRLLVDCPTEKVSSVQMFVKSKFPFDTVLGKDQNFNLNTKLARDNNYGNGFVELEGEASCSSISDAKKSQNVVVRESIPKNENGVEFGVMSSPGVKERRFDMKGKRITNQRPKSGIRRRRKGGFDYGKFSSVSSYDRTCANQLVVSRSFPGINKEQNETIGGISVPVDFGVDADNFLDEGEASTIRIFGDRVLHEFELSQPLDESKPKEKNASFDEELRSDARGARVDGDETNTIKVLEQALEEEHTARSALYLELEKERNAAATAADEAMAMILRLQEEKASIEMQARQYQRIIEEKSAYDAEEMNILKEILLRREREKHFLENEVEAYRQMAYLRNEQLEGDVQDIVDSHRQHLASSLDLTEDPAMMLHELSESIDKKKMIKISGVNLEATSIDKQNCTLAELRSQGWDEDLDKQFLSIFIDDGKQELQEKEMVSMDNSQDAHPEEGRLLKTYLYSYKSSSSQEHNLLENTIPIVGEEKEKMGSTNLCKGKTVKTQNKSGIYTREEGQHFEKYGKDVSLGSKDPCNLMFDKELHVHVIDDKSKLCNDLSENKSELLSVNDTSKFDNSSDLPHDTSVIERIDPPSTSRFVTETDINRSSSDMAIGLPLLSSRSRSLLSELRRSSMSALDTERLKIDTEVEWLRERLRIVQEGREKLSLSAEHQEREKLQLQLLEDIACQLREIRQLTGPGKAIRQVSLPTPSSKVMSKKRRC